MTSCPPVTFISPEPRYERFFSSMERSEPPPSFEAFGYLNSISLCTPRGEANRCLKSKSPEATTLRDQVWEFIWHDKGRSCLAYLWGPFDPGYLCSNSVRGLISPLVFVGVCGSKASSAEKINFPIGNLSKRIVSSTFQIGYKIMGPGRQKWWTMNFRKVQQNRGYKWWLMKQAPFINRLNFQLNYNGYSFQYRVSLPVY